MTPQERMKAQLAGIGIPYREIECYGSQIVITSECVETANKWAMLLAKFATVRGITHSLDKAKEATQKKRTTLHPTYIDVWRTFARI